MKKIAVALLCLFILSGCVKSRDAETVDSLDNTIETITCVDGYKVWVSLYIGMNGRSAMTSQKVGSCDINE